MSRTAINFWLDSGLLLLFLTLCWISIVLRFLFPIGPEAAGWSLWGWTYAEWAATQFAVLAALALGVLVHLMLHWTWICGVIAKRVGARTVGKKAREDASWTIWGVGALIVMFNVLGVAIAAAALTIQSPMP